MSGHRLASASDDGTIRVWDADTGHPIGDPLQGHTGQVSCVAFSPDGRRVVSGSWDATVRVWDAATGAATSTPRFKVADRNGIRFELGAAMPPAPDAAEYPFCYRYALAPRSGAFADWQQGRTLASFDWTDLGAFKGDKKVAQVWLALARERAQGDVADPARAPETPFAVRVKVRPPHGLQPVLGNLVKGVIDGVVCAFQAHTDTAVLPQVVARLATVLPADPVEIEELLLDQRRAVLGVVPRLLYPYRTGVKWDPADHLCVAGELLAAEPEDGRWAIRGEIVELSR
jgi:WD domain, G-beta repeat